MIETHATLERLETRIEDQAARIDALYGLLELRGILPRGVDAGSCDALFDDEPDVVDLSYRREAPRRPKARRAAHFHLGDATGV
jgi:hypothetical protein